MGSNEITILFDVRIYALLRLTRNSICKFILFMYKEAPYSYASSDLHSREVIIIIIVMDLSLLRLSDEGVFRPVSVSP